MSEPVVSLMLQLMNEAFAGVSGDHRSGYQALVPNIEACDGHDWEALPEGGKRSIRDIVLHVGACKYMYCDHAFGEGRLNWDSAIVNPWPTSEPRMGEVLDWLRAGHRRVAHHVATLKDAQLHEMRPANWGEPRELRWLLSVLLQHDLYHAGEINHIRSMRHNDQWAYLS